MRVLGSRLSPTHPAAEPSIKTVEYFKRKTLIWCERASFGIKTLAVLCSICHCERRIWVHWSDVIVWRRCVGWRPVCGLRCSSPSWVQLLIRPPQPAQVLPQSSMALCCSHMRRADIWDWCCLQRAQWRCRSDHSLTEKDFTVKVTYPSSSSCKLASPKTNGWVPQQFSSVCYCYMWSMSPLINQVLVWSIKL